MVYQMSNYTEKAPMGSATRPDTSEPGSTKNRAPVIFSKAGPARLFSDPNTTTIEALSELKTAGYSIADLTGLGLEDKCIEMINSVGFSLVETEELSPGLDTLKNYSLRGSTNVDETIDNSRIVDPDLDKLTPVKEAPIDKFKSASDSFYELDEERSEPIKKIMMKDKAKSKRPVIKVASTLSHAVRKSPNKMLDKTNKRALKR